jgi:hypothetical protein
MISVPARNDSGDGKCGDCVLGWETALVNPTLLTFEPRVREVTVTRYVKRPKSAAHVLHDDRQDLGICDSFAREESSMLSVGIPIDETRSIKRCRYQSDDKTRIYSADYMIELVKRRSPAKVAAICGIKQDKSCCNA